MLIILLTCFLNAVTAIANVKFVSILPWSPIAPGLPSVGAALDLAVRRSVEKYEGFLNISLVKARYSGRTCADFDSETLDFVARQYHTSWRDRSCMAVIGTGADTVTVFGCYELFWPSANFFYSSRLRRKFAGSGKSWVLKNHAFVRFRFDSFHTRRQSAKTETH